MSRYGDDARDAISTLESDLEDALCKQSEIESDMQETIDNLEYEIVGLKDRIEELVDRIRELESDEPIFEAPQVESIYEIN